MANEKLIDANALKSQITRYHMSLTPRYISKLVDAEIGDVIDIIDEAPTVDAVEAGEYEALVGMYHELRENFIDYVCSGIRNEAPYCLNKCDECVDKHGWCKLENCKGFNPAEVILHRFAQMDGDGNG